MVPKALDIEGKRHVNDREVTPAPTGVPAIPEAGSKNE
jgi:hypothetical protein